MQSNCFDNLVSIRGACTETTATSGLYLDDFGVTLNECESYVTGDYSDAEDFVLKKIQASGKMIASSVNTFFSGKMITSPLSDNNRAGYVLQDMEADPLVLATMKGIQFNVYSEKSFLDFYVDYVELFTDFTGSIDVKVYDLFQNKLLDTISVNTTANQISRKTVGKKYSTYRHDMNIAFLYDASTVGAYKTVISATGCGNCRDRNYFFKCNTYTQGRGVQIGVATNKVNENMSGTSYTGGMSVGYSVSCNYDLWLCSIGGLLALPLIYKSCAMIMFAAMNEGKRINTATTINMEQIQRKYNYFDTEYRNEMNRILPLIRIPEDNMCFECNDRVRTRISLP
jgi:hypothetical protein